MINAYLYSHDGQDYANDKWDYGLLKEIFDKHEVDQIRVTEIPKGDKAFVVIPGPQTAGNEDKLSNELNKIHNVNYSERFWNILAGHWLNGYIKSI